MTNVFKDKRQNNEEAKDMASVRKASELISLDELNLPKRIYNCVKDIQPEELVFLVRTRKKIAGIGEKLSRKLEAAMDQAGFIRHDFDDRSFGVAVLYRSVNWRFAGKNGWPYAYYLSFDSNEAYECYENFSETQITAVNDLLNKLFGKEKSLVLQLRYGLKDGRMRTLEETAVELYGAEHEECVLDFDDFEYGEEEDKNFGMSIHRIECESLRMLRGCISARIELDTILAPPAK